VTLGSNKTGVYSRGWNRIQTGRRNLRVSWLVASLVFSLGASAATNEVQVDVHDPALAREGSTYYLFSSGPGITFYSSQDMKAWRRRGRIFPENPSWAKGVASRFNGHVWAPDIVFHQGRFYLYYAVSSPGQNSSAI